MSLKDVLARLFGRPSEPLPVPAADRGNDRRAGADRRSGVDRRQVERREGEYGPPDGIERRSGIERRQSERRSGRDRRDRG